MNFLHDNPHHFLSCTGLEEISDINNSSRIYQLNLFGGIDHFAMFQVYTKVEIKVPCIRGTETDLLLNGFENKVSAIRYFCYASKYLLAIIFVFF